MITGSGFRWFRRVGLLVLSLFVGVPLYAMVLTAFEPLADSRSGFRWVPRHVTLDAFGAMWHTLPLADYLRNSAIVSICSTVVAVSIAIPAAYALARSTFPGRRTVGAALLATQTVPGLLFLVPLFLLYAELERHTGIQLIGSYAGLILTSLTFALPFSIGMLANHFDALPREVEEAAFVDGAGTVSTLIRIVIPTSGPGIAAVALFAFMLAWSEVLFATVLTDDATRTLAVGLPAYAGEASAYWNQLMAAALVSSLPVLVVFLGLQRSLVRGLGLRRRPPDVRA